MAGVASAAIIEGSLIIGLDDGSIINCGYVAGPQGLKGDPGPMGATGERGTDGNTIHTVAGTPGNEMGTDGDYAIDNINWRIYGPKSGGIWGKAKEMLPGKEILENGRTQSYSGATGGGGGSGGGQPIGQVFTNTVIATGQGRLVQNSGQGRVSVDYPGGPEGIIPPAFDMQVQSNINAFFVTAVEALEFATAQEIKDRIKGDEELKKLIEDEIAGAIRAPIYADNPPTSHPDFTGPDADLIEGDVWYDTSNEGIRYRYDNGQWIAQERPSIFSDTEPTEHPSLQGPSAALQQGDIWFDTDDGLLEYIYDGTQWVEQGGAYVKKKGDEMSGDLNMLDNFIHNVKDPSLQKDAANRQFTVAQSIKAASIPVQQADWLNQVYSSGLWVLQADGATDPDIQRFILSDNSFADTDDLGNVKYVSIHALGSGDFINYQNEEVGDTIQIYGNPDVGDTVSFGIYTIDAITEHNMPAPGPGADYSDAFVAYTVTPLATYGTLEVDELCQIKTMPPVGVGGANVEIGPNTSKPDDEYEAGDLWFDTSRLELFVYYVDPDGNGGWVSSSPLGARVEAGEIIQAQLVERVTAGEAAQATLQGKVSALETGETNYVKKDTANEVTTAFRVKSSSKTFISTNNNELGLYNLADPTNDAHALNRGYADGRYLKKTGGTLTGNLSFSGGSRIDANTGNSVLTGRACLELRSAADLPIAISSGSTFKPLLAFYGYDGSAADNKEKVAEIKANGNAYFTNVYAENKKLATQEYVDERVPAAVSHLDFKCASSVDPTYARDPAAGQIVGYFENNPGDGSKAHNMYIGNWVHSVRIHVSDLKVNGTLPAAGSSDYSHRGIFEMHTSNGEKLLHKAVVSSMNRSGDILTLNFEGGMNLYGTSDTTTQSSARYLFYSLL